MVRFTKIGHQSPENPLQNAETTNWGNLVHLMFLQCFCSASKALSTWKR